MKPKVRSAAVIATVAGMASVAGCAPPETIEIGVRDPSAATIVIETENGPQVLLEPGRAREERELPRTSPPYRNKSRPNASAIREEGGGVTMRCDVCMDVGPLRTPPRVQLLPTGEGKLELFVPERKGELPEIAWTADELHVRMSQSYFEGYGRGRRWYEAYRYELVVPRAALTEVRRKREDVNTKGWIALVVGAALTAASVTLIVDGARQLPAATNNGKALGPALELAGGSLLAVPALGLGIYGLMYAGAPDGFDQRIGP